MTATYPVNTPSRFNLRETNSVQGTWLVLGATGVGYTSVAALIAAGDTLPPSQVQAPYGANFAGMQLTITNDGGAGVAGSGFYVVINPRVPPATTAEGIEILAGGSYGPTPGPFYQIWFLKQASADRLTFAFAF